jgi:hypothetical protein
MRSAKRACAAVSVAALGLVMFIAPMSSASAGPEPRAPSTPTTAYRPPGLTPRVYALMMAQIPLDKAATAIQRAAAKPGTGHDGFFQTHVNDATHTLTVLWHGSVPADITRLINRLRARVHIRITHTRYNLARLIRAVHQALRIDPSAVAAYPLTNGSGVHIEVHATAEEPAAARARAQAAALALRPRLGVPVTTSLSGGVTAQSCPFWNPNDNLGPGSRCWDLPPGFWGGDLIRNSQYDDNCTGGFGVHDAWGNTYMLTAAHCAHTPNGLQNGIGFWNGNYTAYMGQITDVPGSYDWAVIPTSTGNQYYDGPGIYAGDSNWTKYVVGQLYVSPGDWLCESGALGGVICAFTVQYLNFNCDAQCGSWQGMAFATPANPDVWPVPGDSGGPWFSLAGSNSVYAMGIHHGLDQIPYGKTYVPDGALFTPISFANDSGFWVNT